MDISRATADEAATLTSIAHAAKRHWGYPERWIEQWADVLTITPAFIASAEVFTGRIDGRTIGFHALIRDADSLRLDHLWVMPDAIGRGLGRKLFEHAIARAEALGFRRIEIQSDPNAEAFYRHMGARRVGETVTQIEGRPRGLPDLRFDLPGRAPE